MKFRLTYLQIKITLFLKSMNRNDSFSTISEEATYCLPSQETTSLSQEIDFPVSLQPQSISPSNAQHNFERRRIIYRTEFLHDFASKIRSNLSEVIRLQNNRNFTKINPEEFQGLEDSTIQLLLALLSLFSQTSDRDIKNDKLIKSFTPICNCKIFGQILCPFYIKKPF
jgi:hypothetical protein